MPTSLTSNKITFNTKSISETNGKLDILPVGFVYWQLPGKKAPGDMFAGTWTNISSQFAGLFFRAEGGNANAFDGGAQEDKIRNITGEVTIGNATPLAINPANGVFDVTAGPVGVISTTTFEAEKAILHFDSNNGELTVNPMAGHADGPEIRPVNTTIRIWERTA